jgi:hypothetical protein
MRHKTSRLSGLLTLSLVKCRMAAHVIKIDVEGLELDVLKGLDWDSQRAPRHVLLEVNACVERSGNTADTVLRLLRDRGYEPLTIHGDPFDSSREPPESNVWFRAQ